MPTEGVSDSKQNVAQFQGPILFHQQNLSRLGNQAPRIFQSPGKVLPEVSLIEPYPVTGDVVAARCPVIRRKEFPPKKLMGGHCPEGVQEICLLGLHDLESHTANTQAKLMVHIVHNSDSSKTPQRRKIFKGIMLPEVMPARMLPLRSFVTGIVIEDSRSTY